MITLLINIVVIVAVACAVIYCLQLIPLPEPFHRIISVVVGLIVLLWVLSLFTGEPGYLIYHRP